MPKYVTINDDLQLIPGKGFQFLSKSGKTLDEVEYVLLDWLDKNPAHPIHSLVNSWLDLADQYRDERRRAIAVEAERKELEKGIERQIPLYMAGRAAAGKPVSREVAEARVRAMFEAD